MIIKGTNSGKVLQKEDIERVIMYFFFTPKIQLSEIPSKLSIF